MLNKQNENDGGIVAFESAGASKSESAKSGLERIDAVDKLVAVSFGTVGFLGLLHKINEEESIDILTRVVSKANDLERVIGTIDEGGGTRRLQTFGTNDNLFVAYIQVSVLKLQGLNDQAILDQLSMMFTKRVVRIIAGILGFRPATPPPTPGCLPLPNDGTGTVGTNGGCSLDIDCFGCELILFYYCLHFHRLIIVNLTDMYLSCFSLMSI